MQFETQTSLRVSLYKENSDLLRITCHFLGTFDCSEDFFLFENKTCVPICPSWRRNSQAVTTILDVSVLLTYPIGFIASMAILIIAAFRYKTMLVTHDPSRLAFTST